MALLELKYLKMLALHKRYLETSYEKSSIN